MPGGPAKLPVAWRQREYALKLEELWDFEEAHFVRKVDAVEIDARVDPTTTIADCVAGKDPANYVLIQTAILLSQRFPLRCTGTCLIIMFFIFTCFIVDQQSI